MDPDEEDSFHGTHVAGTIGAGLTNNGAGVAGGAWLALTDGRTATTGAPSERATPETVRGWALALKRSSA